MLALFKAVMDRLGDDFGLLAGDATAGELLGDGEGVEHAQSAYHAPARADAVAANGEDLKDVTGLNPAGFPGSPADNAPIAGERRRSTLTAVIGPKDGGGCKPRCVRGSAPARGEPGRLGLYRRWTLRRVWLILPPRGG